MENKEETVGNRRKELERRKEQRGKRSERRNVWY